MSAYRMYFLASGQIRGREDFAADDDIAAIRIGRVLYDTFSDVCDRFELWQETRRIILEHQAHYQKPCLEDLIEAHQREVLDTEERISKSKWRIAQSRRLIEAVGRLKSAQM